MSSYVTVAGKSVNEKRLDIIANNLANSSTAGYKAVRPSFSMLSEATDVTGETVELKNSLVGIYDTSIDFSDGPVVDSGSPLDVAIVGNGFFVIQGENGNMYTRNGQFAIDGSKRLVTMSGDPVMGKSGEITVDSTEAKNILIESDGSVYLGNDLIGTLKVVDFADKKGLKAAGKSYFVNENEAEPEITPELYSVHQGSYESSNVNVFREMVDMIQTMRAYECYTKVDQMVSDVNGKLIEMGKF